MFDSEVDSTNSEDSLEEFLPSVTIGPLDIRKAKQLLNWKPTPFQQALQITCNWFEKAWFDYHDECPLEEFEDEKMVAEIEKAYHIQSI